MKNIKSRRGKQRSSKGRGSEDVANISITSANQRDLAIKYLKINNKPSVQVFLAQEKASDEFEGVMRELKRMTDEFYFYDLSNRAPCDPDTHEGEIYAQNIQKYK